MAQAFERQPEQRWIYNQRTGQLRLPDGRLDPDRGYSGAPGYVNTPEAEHLPFRGPIPRGRWRIGEAYDSERRGPLTIVLEPNGHNAHGRTYMRVHGDRRDNDRRASSGCVILNRRQREALNDSRVRFLDVVDEPEWRQ